MKKKSPIQTERRWDAAALDELIDEFTVEAAGDDERILAFLQALEKHVALRVYPFSGRCRSLAPTNLDV